MAIMWIAKRCMVETNKTDELCMNFLHGYLAVRNVVFLFLIYLLLLKIFTVLHWSSHHLAHWSSRHLASVDSLGTSQRYPLFHHRAFVCSSLNEVVFISRMLGVYWIKYFAAVCGADFSTQVQVGVDVNIPGPKNQIRCNSVPSLLPSWVLPQLEKTASSLDQQTAFRWCSAKLRHEGNLQTALQSLRHGYTENIKSSTICWNLDFRDSPDSKGCSQLK